MNPSPARAHRATGRRTGTLAAACLGTLLLAVPVGAQDSPDERPADTKVIEIEESGGNVLADLLDKATREGQEAKALFDFKLSDARKQIYDVFAPGGTRTLVLPPANAQPEAVAKLTEDLTVLRRILAKATRNEEARGNVEFHLGGWSPLGGNLDALYLDGYGAVFVLRVDHPLAGPEKAKNAPPKEPVDTTWEEARRELRQGRGNPLEVRIWSDDRDDAGSYDPEQVAALKQRLIAALKHASNLDAVRDDEAIVVAVLGRRAATAEVRKIERNNGREVYAVEKRDESAGAGGSVLWLRVRKSDVDAFAAGKLDAEDFAEKVTVTTY